MVNIVMVLFGFFKVYVGGFLLFYGRIRGDGGVI